LSSGRTGLRGGASLGHNPDGTGNFSARPNSTGVPPEADLGSLQELQARACIWQAGALANRDRSPSDILEDEAVEVGEME
jgi:hypothetical protein